MFPGPCPVQMHEVVHADFNCVRPAASAKTTRGAEMPTKHASRAETRQSFACPVQSPASLACAGQRSESRDLRANSQVLASWCMCRTITCVRFEPVRWIGLVSFCTLLDDVRAAGCQPTLFEAGTRAACLSLQLRSDTDCTPVPTSIVACSPYWRSYARLLACRYRFGRNSAASFGRGAARLLGVSRQVGVRMISRTRL